MSTSRASSGLIAPAVARNREPILAVLRRIVPAAGTVLEIASGTGAHAVHFARDLPNVSWQPTDRDTDALRSIAAHREAASLPNLLPSLELDATCALWPAVQVDVVVAINMIHIAPWSATLGLIAGADRVLLSGGALFLYGPFVEEGRPTTPSNVTFDASLRARDPAWGVRRLEDVVDLAKAHGLEFVERIPMPANNLSLVFRRRGV